MLPEAVGPGVKTEPMRGCINDFGHSHYDSPAPPDDHGPHGYLFIIAETSLLGTYGGRRRSAERSSAQ